MKKRILIKLSIIILLLMIPLISMQFTDEVNWEKLDFSVAAILLVVLFSIHELFEMRIKSDSKKRLAILFSIIIFIIVWAELAVGVF
ncbi:MAG: hypothetical protein HN427_01770 [Flavobacteriales bacterium]|jgi:hypothetical protein|nr:hypothetical protein [Flavobacteriales bacterium]MBT7480871.1 hypothetical protein [Flavobacteriales bacterium]